MGCIQVIKFDLDNPDDLDRLMTMARDKTANQFHMDTGLHACDIIVKLAEKLLEVTMEEIDEDMVIVDGKTYVTIEQNSCDGCAFAGPLCRTLYNNVVYCEPETRSDNKSIIWVERVVQ